MNAKYHYTVCFSLIIMMSLSNCCLTQPCLQLPSSAVTPRFSIFQSSSGWSEVSTSAAFSFIEPSKQKLDSSVGLDGELMHLQIHVVVVLSFVFFVFSLKHPPIIQVVFLHLWPYDTISYTYIIFIKNQ